MTIYQQWILQRRPEGRVKRSDFELRDTPLRSLEPNECLVRIL